MELLLVNLNKGNGGYTWERGKWSIKENAAAAKSLQSCPTLCDPIDGSPPGSPVPGILQARTLEWVAISFSSAWKWKVKVKSLSHVQLFVTPWTAAYQVPLPMGFSRQEYRSGVPLPSPKRKWAKVKSTLWDLLLGCWCLIYAGQKKKKVLHVSMDGNYLYSQHCHLISKLNNEWLVVLIFTMNILPWHRYAILDSQAQHTWCHFHLLDIITNYTGHKFTFL